MGYFFYTGIQEDIEAGQPINVTVQDTWIDENTERDPGETRSSTTYRPVVNYTYTINGTSYQSTSIFPGGAVAKSDREWAESVINEYDPGTTVQGYYVPDNPDTSYLKKDNPSIIPLLFLAAGVLMVVWAGVKIARNL